MSHLIQKHQLNKRGRGVITFTPEQIAEFEQILNPTRIKSETTNEPAKRVQQKQLIMKENTSDKRNQRVEYKRKQQAELSKSPWYSRLTPLLNVDTNGSYHAYNAEQFYKDQTGKEMPLSLRPTASDNIRVGMTAPSTLGTIAGMYHPIVFLTSLGGGATGGGVWDTGSRILTGNSWADNMSLWTGMPKDLAFSTNPGMWFGGITGPYRARVAMYNNKSPYGYASNGDIPGLRKPLEEVGRGIADWFHPFRSWKPKETPYWKAIMQSENLGKVDFNDNLKVGAATEFRDMIYRKALGLPQNKNGTIFIDNGDGTLGVDMAKRNAINRQYGGADYDDGIVVFGLETDVSPTRQTFLSHDRLTGVGGFTEGEFNYDPVNDIYTGISTDVWDLHPFGDARTVWKWGTNHIPGLKNLEIIRAMGKTPPKVRYVIEEPIRMPVPKEETNFLKLSKPKNNYKI